MKLTKEQERIFEVLADECERNPQTCLTGLDIRLPGKKVGAYRGIGVVYGVANLTYSGFVSSNGNKVIITQQGLGYVKSHKKRPLNAKLIRSKIIIPIVITVIAGLVIAFITGWRPW